MVVAVPVVVVIALVVVIQPTVVVVRRHFAGRYSYLYSRSLGKAV